MVNVIAAEVLPVLGDRIQLQQVILNLVMNGIDAMSGMPSESRIISILTSRLEKFAQLSVSDSGPGIPEDKLKEVFEPFSPARPKAWAWDCPSHAPLSRRTMGGYRQEIEITAARRY